MLTLLLVLLPMLARAQYNFDVPAVEAYINDHKKQRSLLLARSVLETTNKTLHTYSSKAAEGYRDINESLDDYTRAFDVIDMLYRSLRTGLNAYGTYEKVSKRVSDYKTMLGTYGEWLKERKPSLSDTIIAVIGARCVTNIVRDGERLYKSLTDLALYATGAAACSTTDLMAVMTDINRSLDDISRHINSAYLDTWRYIQVRMGYWKESVYRTRTKRQIIESAFGRWMKASRDALEPGVNEIPPIDYDRVDTTPSIPGLGGLQTEK
jgi:hypothetical protein